MAKLRSISTAIWSDPFIEELTPQQKLLFIYLITNEKTNMLGVYEVSNRKISFETGISVEDINKAFERFETLSKVKRVGNFIILCNFLKNQNFNKNMMKSAIDIYNNLPKELKFSGLELDRNKTNQSFETLCKGFGMVRKVEDEVEDEYEVEDEEKENNDLAPFDLIEKELKNQLDTWKMQNLKRVNDFDELVASFNDTAEIEILSDSKPLEFNSKMLLARFKKFSRSWISNQKPESKVIGLASREKSYDPDFVYYKTNHDPTVRKIHKDRWLSFKQNEELGGRVFTVVYPNESLRYANGN